MQKEVLILGEFPPNTHTGISICNKMVSEVLSLEEYSINIVEEFSWNKSCFNIAFHFASIYLNVFKILVKKKIDVIYFNLPLSAPAMLKIAPAIMLVRLISQKSKIIAHLHRGDFAPFIKRSASNRFISNLYFRRIDKLIILSKKFKKDIRNFNSEISISILHNTSDFEKENINIKKSFSNNYVCIANYIESKGIRELFNSFCSPQLEHMHLSIYGNAYDNKLFNELKASHPINIEINGAINRSEIRNILLETDCLILPSWNEGQPIILLEAMSLGIPIIASSVGDIPNILGEAYEYLACSQDQDSLKETILKFHNNSNKEELANYLHNRYLKYFSNENFKQGIIEIFSSI